MVLVFLSISIILITKQRMLQTKKICFYFKIGNICLSIFNLNIKSIKEFPCLHIQIIAIFCDNLLLI